MGLVGGFEDHEAVRSQQGTPPNNFILIHEFDLVGSTMISQEFVCISDTTLLDLRWHDREVCQRKKHMYICPVSVG